MIPEPIYDEIESMEQNIVFILTSQLYQLI